MRPPPDPNSNPNPHLGGERLAISPDISLYLPISALYLPYISALEESGLRTKESAFSTRHCSITWVGVGVGVGVGVRVGVRVGVGISSSSRRSRWKWAKKARDLERSAERSPCESEPEKASPGWD